MEICFQEVADANCNSHVADSIYDSLNELIFLDNFT